MPTYGPNGPSTVSSSSAVGSHDWTTQSNVLADDGANTESLLGSAPYVSYYLLVTNFGFSIPSTESIVGIAFSLEKGMLTLAGSDAIDNVIRLVVGGSVTGDDKSNLISWGLGAATHGGATDLWGTTPTYSDINASNFGIAISGKSVDFSVQLRLDYVSCTIYTASTAQLRTGIYHYPAHF